MSVADLVREDFAEHLGSIFALLFRSDVQQVVPPGMYRFEHDAMGMLGIGMSPVARIAAGVEYEAVFN